MTDTHIESLYQEARSAIKARDYEYAIELLKRVLVVDENYKDTSRLLEKAIRLRKLRWYKNPTLWGALGLVVVFVLGIVIAPRIGSLFASPAPTETLIPTATRTSAPTKTSIPTATPTSTARPTSTATPIPSWVTNFAEPILAAIQDREPYFQDDFGPNTQGWTSYFGSISLEDGVIRLKQGGILYNVFLRRMPNYVFQVDIARPTSGHVQVWIADQNSFNINPDGWVMDGTGCGQTDCQYHEQAFSQIIQLIVIVRGSRAGFYLAESPVFYFEDPNLADIGQSGHDVSFRCKDFCELDNVKFWDLDKVPNPP